MPPEDNPADDVPVDRDEYELEEAARVGYEAMLDSLPPLRGDHKAAHRWENQSNALKDDWRAAARAMLAPTLGRAKAADDEVARLRGDMQRVVSGLRSHLGDLIRRIGPARRPEDIRAELEAIHDAYNAWADKSAEADRDRLKKIVLHAHVAACRPDNCVLDGGPEHEEAFR